MTSLSSLAVSQPAPRARQSSVVLAAGRSGAGSQGLDDIGVIRQSFPTARPVPDRSPQTARR